MKTHLSLHQRIQNADASQQIENVKAVHAYTHARNWPSEEWNNVWDLSDDCSWAHGFGRWRGGYKVYLNSVTEWDVQAFDTYKKLYKKFPDIMGMDPRPLNVSPMHILCNEVIEVADDGRSGRAAYMTPGHIFTYLRTAGTRWATLMWERYGSDFVCDKDGHWKYLHEHVCPDIGCGYDGKSNWGLTAYQMAMDPKAFMPPDMGDYEPRDYQVDDPGPLHRDYGFLVPVQNTCPWPEPYQTMDEAHSYTPPRA